MIEVRPDPDEERMVTMTEIADELKISTGYVRRWRAEGLMPPPDDNPSPRRIRWKVSTINEWLSRGGPDKRVITDRLKAADVRSKWWDA